MSSSETMAPFKLESERLILRPFTSGDAEEMYVNWGGDPEVTRFMHHDSAASPLETLNRIQGWMLTHDSPEAGVWNYFAIILKDGGAQIGTIFYAHANINAQSAEVGYEIGKLWWRHGYTSEALSALLRFLFEEKRLNRVYGAHDPRNPHSGAVMQKCGMRYEGTMRQERLVKGELIDRAYYAILADEFY